MVTTPDHCPDLFDPCRVEDQSSCFRVLPPAIKDSELHAGFNRLRSTVGRMPPLR